MVKHKTLIRSVAHYVPSRVVTNDELSKLMDTSDEWIIERTGIKERRFVESSEVATSHLSEQACNKALADAGWKATDIDLIVAATLSPDYNFPGIGTQLQHRLGCRTIPALDIRAQCSGFVYGISCVDAFIKAGQFKKILLVCAEVQSVALDFTTRGREMAVLFGDGAGALAIEAVPVESDDLVPKATNKERGVIDSIIASDGSGAEQLCMKVPGIAHPGFVSHADIDEGRVHPSMDGRVVFKNAITRLLEVITQILTKNKISPNEISLLVPHQANLRINEMVREHLKLPEDRVFNTIEKYGNTTAATIPIGLSEAVRKGRLKEGDLLLTAAFGAGFTWGANLIRW